MATQIKWGVNATEYCVIDDGTPFTFPTFNAGTHIGYDTLNNGTLTQGTNPYTNGTIPAFLASGATTVLNSPSTTRLLFRNPA